MLYGINVLLFTAISVVVSLYLLRRQRRILTSQQLKLHTDVDS